MCGRYAASTDPDALVEELEIEDVEDAPPGADPGYAADWNVAPTKQPPAVWERPPREDRDAPPVRRLRPLSWGLVPTWAKDRSVGNRMINARVESLLEKSSYRKAALARRCLVPADGWYEWQASPVVEDGRGKPRKQPFFVRLASGGPLTLAGIYELWRDRDRDGDDPLAWHTSFAVVTTTAEEGLDRIHERMPVVVPPDRWDAWLDPAVSDEDDVRALLEPVAPGRFEAVAVSTRVNDVRHNGPELVEALSTDELHGVVDPRTGEILGAPGQALF